MELPFPSHVKPTRELDMIFKAKQLLDHNIYGPVFYHNGKWWVRCSAQIWNQVRTFVMISGAGYHSGADANFILKVEDFERLGKALRIVCEEISQALSYTPERAKL